MKSLKCIDVGKSSQKSANRMERLYEIIRTKNEKKKTVTTKE